MRLNIFKKKEPSLGCLDNFPQPKPKRRLFKALRNERGETVFLAILGFLNTSLFTIGGTGATWSATSLAYVGGTAAYSFTVGQALLLSATIASLALSVSSKPGQSSFNSNGHLIARREVK